MSQRWDVDELVRQFTLLPEEINFIGINSTHNQLGKAVLLKWFQYEKRFPESKAKVSKEIIEYVGKQLSIEADSFKDYQWDGRTIKEHRRQIREWLGFHPATVDDQKRLSEWLEEEVLPEEHRREHLAQRAYQRLSESQIEPPTEGRMARLVRSALYQYEQSFFENTAAHLPELGKKKLLQLIYRKAELKEETEIEEMEEDSSNHYLFHELKSGPGEARVRNIKKVAERLNVLQEVKLPPDLFQNIPLRFLRQYQQQAAVESISHLQRRDKNAQTYTLLASFCWVRQRAITDQLVDLFIKILNDIALRAEERVKREILMDFIQVEGKQQLLFRLAEAMLENPDGIIRETLYPVVSEEQLHSIVEEAKSKGVYQKSVQFQISASYTHHYRQMLPPLFEVLTFRSNNDQYKPLIEALEVVAMYLQEKDPFYPQEQAVPMEGVIQKQWQNWIYQNDQKGQRRVRRVRYELCVLQSLREKLRCKEIWVEGADRYRNPDEDVPADFNEKRKEYYVSLSLPL